MFDRVPRCTGSLRSRVGRLAVGCLLAAGLAGSAAAQTPVNTAFTYQGQLSASGSPINGTADLSVTLFDAATGGGAYGTVNLTNVAVTDGLFTTQLNFGNQAFFGNARWLEIAVRSPAGSGSFTTLTPRQPLTAAPYAASLVPGARISGAPSGLFAGVLTVQATQPGIGLAGYGSSATDTGIFGANGDLSSVGALGSGQWGVYGINTNGGFAGYFESGNAYFGGNVGIGTTTPTSKLDVAGVVEADGFKLNGNGAAAGRVLTSDASGVATWQVPTGGSQWITNGSNIGYTAGNVGIGNTTPNPNFRLQTSAGGPGPWRGGIAATGPINSAVMGELNGVATIGGHNAALSAWSNLCINPFDGNVGIGTTTPMSKLDVVGAVKSTGLSVTGNGDFSGNVGIGTTTPAVPLHVATGTDASLAGGGYQMTGAANGLNIVMDNNEIIARNNGAAAPLFLNQGSGTVVVPVLQITGGSDVAEPFNVNAGTEARRHEGTEGVRPGTVVSIDPDRLGELRVCTKAFDRTVAGIISGANGVNPGMVLSQTGSVADGKHPVALTGRVWCWCDAEAAGAIVAGDMLTTSDTPGHAMRVADHDQAAGAVIGKAMSPLKSGKGLVLVLVSLQ